MATQYTVRRMTVSEARDTLLIARRNLDDVCNEIEKGGKVSRVVDGRITRTRIK